MCVYNFAAKLQCCIHTTNADFYQTKGALVCDDNLHCARQPQIKGWHDLGGQNGICLPNNMANVEHCSKCII